MGTNAMLYIPLSTENIDYGWQLSAAMWSVTMPDPDTTQYYSAPRAHPTTGEVHLPINADDEQRIHPDADLTGLLTALTAVSSASREQISASLEAARGTRIRMADIVPPDVTPLTAWPEPEDKELV